MSAPAKIVWRDVLLVTLLALGVRVAFVFFAGPHVYGDGTGYPRQGMQIATGEGQLDKSWLGAYSLWMAAVYLLVPSLKWCAIVGAFVPGVLLVSVAHVLGGRLYNRSTGLLCGLFCALHPLLITYSTNGYMETFYCLLLALATLMMCESFLAGTAKRRRVCAMLAGAAMAIAFATRNEVLPLALASILVPLLGWKRGGGGDSWRKLTANSLATAGGLLAGLGLYVMVAFAATGSVGLFGKVGNLSRHSDIFLEREAAAAEVYGAGGIIERSRGQATNPSSGAVAPDEAEAEAASEAGFGIRLSTLSKRFINNIQFALPQSAVRLFASPLPLLALIPILGWLCRRGWRRELIPPCLMLAFFPALFSLYAVQPRYLMPTVVPVHLFAAAGAVMLASWLSQRKWSRGVTERGILTAGTAALVAVLAIATVWKGSRIRDERDLHQELAAWLIEQVPMDSTISGCGFGHIGDTTFRSGHPFLVRLHTDEPDELSRFVREKTDGWLVLYEDYLGDANPALLGYLDADRPLPGFRRRHEVSIPGGLRAQVFELEKSSVASTGEEAPSKP